ncbi:phytanoyl- dioxygenase [Fusarium austroafricanum]|uniref:Phytanoyl- dioxygenase n=1 Tax=Fusarium austroafricanum TaxID=2364996 RepID=A0A8H4KMV3_9HYPO|nr:phytanoyl- dioxygenase [Fusarium austroafricanum]
MVANTEPAGYQASSALKLTEPTANKPRQAQPSGPNKLFAEVDATYGDWRGDLVRDGYAVVKRAIPKERAEKYGDEILTYLETFNGGMGFKRDDPSTVKNENLPAIRQEPGIIEAFERVYDTKDLIVSFDAINTSFPGRKDVKANKPWPHQDQDPEKPGFRCLQGLVNILPNGGNDGGLIVCKGAHLLSEEFHKDFKNEPNKIWAWTKEWYGFTDEGMQWLKNKGCEWIKINAKPGDLLVWDSRTPHYNVSPEADATQGDLIRKKGAFENLQSTTHWPNAMHVGRIPILRDGKPCPYDTGKPREAPKLTNRGFELTGIPYIVA